MAKLVVKVFLTIDTGPLVVHNHETHKKELVKDIVQDGGGAQLVYLKAIGQSGEKLNTHQVETIREQLLAYCKLDTFAMVKIWQKLTCHSEVNWAEACSA